MANFPRVNLMSILRTISPLHPRVCVLALSLSAALFADPLDTLCLSPVSVRPILPRASGSCFTGLTDTTLATRMTKCLRFGAIPAARHDELRTVAPSHGHGGRPVRRHARFPGRHRSRFRARHVGSRAVVERVGRVGAPGAAGVGRDREGSQRRAGTPYHATRCAGAACWTRRRYDSSAPRVHAPRSSSGADLHAGLARRRRDAVGAARAGGGSGARLGAHTGLARLGASRGDRLPP